MVARAFLSAAVCVLGIALASQAFAQADHGHSHGQGEPVGTLEDIGARASVVGSQFQFVAIPADGRLAIFVDHAETNLPVVGARVELIVGDSFIIADEEAPGLYLAVPWPPEGQSDSMVASIEIVATIAAGSGEELLLARMSTVDSHGHTGHGGDTHGAAGTSDRTALWDGVRPVVLPLAAGLAALLGAIAALRHTGRRRWLGVTVSGAGVIALMATTGLV